MTAKRPTIGVAFSGVGALSLDQSLDTFFANPLPDEIVFAIDDVGRSFSYPVRCSDLNLDEYHPRLRVVTNRSFGNWQHANQTVNQSVKAMSSDWMLLAQDDQIWPRFDYLSKWHQAIAWLEERNFIVDGKVVIGISWPSLEFSIREFQDRCLAHRFAGKACLTQFYWHITTIVRRSTWYEWGPASESDGIAWEWSMMEEMRRRGWWLLYLAWPFVGHIGSQSNGANDWAMHKHAPLWNDSRPKCLEKYGHEFAYPKEFIPCPEAEILV